MRLLEKISNLPKWVIAAGSAIGTALLSGAAWFGTDYNQFRSQQLVMSRSAVEQTLAADSDLDVFIVKFKDLIVGKATVSDRDRDAFADKLRKSYSKAEETRNRYPSIDDAFERYTASLVGLRKSLENLDGPADGKKYFIALSKYVVAQAEWKKRVTDAQNSYIRSFAFR